MDDSEHQFDHAQRRAEHINRGTGSWKKKCKECGKWFLRDRHTYDYEVCPECLERIRAQRDAAKTEEQIRAWREEELEREAARERERVRARAQAEWSHSILELCRICNNFYRAPLADTPAPKICPDCQQREKDKVAGRS